MSRIDLKTIVIVALSLIFVVMLFMNRPLSETKAFELAQKFQQQGLFCSGYHYEKGDNTCYVVFRDKKTYKITKTINTSYSTAEKIYTEFGD